MSGRTVFGSLGFPIERGKRVAPGAIESSLVIHFCQAGLDQVARCKAMETGQ